MIENNKNIKHDVIIKSRNRLEMTGISDVISYDENEILVVTDEISISIEGENLKIEKFDSEKEDLIVNGLINGIFYINKDLKKKKLFFK